MYVKFCLYYMHAHTFYMQKACCYKNNNNKNKNLKK